MKFSLNWLKEFVDIRLSAQELADKLSLSGFEVESVTPVGEALCNVVTGRIEKIEPHPNADRLRITQIFDGTTTHQIVTAAQNIVEGAIVPVSLPGAVLATGLKIKKSALRGVESNGMLCSQVELGLAEVSDGIWLLPPDTPLGVDVVSWALLKDFILDISILPNRGDCQSILGVAREISALLNTPLKQPETPLNLSDLNSIDLKLESAACPFYTARFIESVQIKPSPIWMQRRLQLSGIRPINNVVDITNYVMLECGQPLHAFDASTAQGAIEIRQARPQETLTVLDGSTAQLSDSDLVIADAKHPLAVAGVMGGSASGVQESTQTLILESAYFDPRSIRKTRTALGYRTESAIRFEKGIDPCLVTWASDRAAALLQASGAQVGALQKAGSLPFESGETIAWSADRINAMLGSTYEEAQMKAALTQLGFDVETTTVKVPSWRALDVKELPCLAEEVGRILGFDQIPSQLSTRAVPLEKESALLTLRKKIEAFLIHRGFTQLNTFPMVSELDFAHTRIPITERTFRVSNPLTPEESVMRHQLLPSLLKAMAFNRNRGEKHLSLFEVGKVYVNTGEASEETWQLTVILTGDLFQNAYFSSDKAQNQMDFFVLKGLAQALLESLDSTYVAVHGEVSQNPQLNPGQSMALRFGDIEIGEVGLLHPRLAQAYGCDAEVGILTLEVSRLAQIERQPVVFQPIAKFPSVRRDVSLLASKSLAYEEILQVIRSAQPPLLKQMFLFDYFESEALGADKKSLALGFIYQDEQKTLVDEDVQSVHQSICEALKTLPITIR